MNDEFEKPTKKKNKKKKNFPNDHEKKIHRVGRDAPKYKITANNWQQYQDDEDGGDGFDDGNF